MRDTYLTDTNLILLLKISMRHHGLLLGLGGIPEHHDFSLKNGGDCTQSSGDFARLTEYQFFHKGLSELSEFMNKYSTKNMSST